MQSEVGAKGVNYMQILNRNTIKDYMINDLEMILACSNEETFIFLHKEGIDIYDFINKINE